MVPKGENPAESGDRTRRRTLRTRRRLLEAALALFIDRGAEAVTIEQITERADVGKGTFYRHFSSKDEVVRALVDQAVARLASRIRAAEPSGKDPDHILSHLLDVHSQFLTENTDEFALLFQSRVLVKLQSDTAAELDEAYGRYLEALEQHLSLLGKGGAERARTRRVACVLAEYAFAVSAFSAMKASGAEVDAAVDALRRALVASMAAFLSHQQPAAKT